MKRNFNLFTTLWFYLAEMLLLFLKLPTVSSYIYLNAVEIDKSENGEKNYWNSYVKFSVLKISHVLKLNL